jgi:hypothetical protein
MSRPRLETLLFALLVAIAALLGATAAPPRANAGLTTKATNAANATNAQNAADERSAVIYPAQSIPLRFDHRRHLETTKLTCVFCHDHAATSRRSADLLLPDAARCDACHGTDHEHREQVSAGVGPAKDCGYCHDGYRATDGNAVARVVLPAPNLRFDHAIHYVAKIACSECHAGVERALTASVATRAMLPTMRTCLRCHSTSRAPPNKPAGGCDVCHVTVEGTRLQTAFATGQLFPPAWLNGAEHGPDFVLRHKDVAAADSAFCGNCHAEKECVDCHDGRVRPRQVHPNDWLNLHAMASRQNDPNCTSCHREQSFCITCHERAGVSMSGPFANTAEQGRFHPPRAIWTDPPRTAGHHAWEAERNISACVSCHTERDCATCHATAARGGRGGLSPHPAGFASDCRIAFAKNARPCLFCHAPADPALTECR